MNKEKTLEWINTEIEKEIQKCDNAKSTRIQDNHLAIIVGIDRVKEYIQSEPEENLHETIYNFFTQYDDKISLTIATQDHEFLKMIIYNYIHDLEAVN